MKNQVKPHEIFLNHHLEPVVIYYFVIDMYNPKNNPFRVPMDNDIFTLRERERDAKLQV